MIRNQSCCTDNPPHHPLNRLFVGEYVIKYWHSNFCYQTKDRSVRNIIGQDFRWFPAIPCNKSIGSVESTLLGDQWINLYCSPPDTHHTPLPNVLRTAICTQRLQPWCWRTAGAAYGHAIAPVGPWAAACRLRSVTGWTPYQPYTTTECHARPMCTIVVLTHSGHGLRFLPWYVSRPPHVTHGALQTHVCDNVTEAAPAIR